MSHLVCACAAKPKAKASAPTSVLVLSMVPPWRRMLAQFLAREPRQGEACREAGRFDAIELHEPRHAVAARALDLEVGRRLARPGGLRPDAGVARRERGVGQAWPVAADRRVEALGATRIHVIVDALDPFDIRPEARLSGE